VAEVTREPVFSRPPPAAPRRRPRPGRGPEPGGRGPPSRCHNVTAITVPMPHRSVRVTAPLRFVSSAGEGFDGQMLVFDPPSVMEFTWGADLVRIELRPDGAGTLLTLTDTFDDLGKAARDAAGWHECLDRLVGDLAGTPPSAWDDRWRPLHPVYVASLGPGASRIGPPPGWEEHLDSQA